MEKLGHCSQGTLRMREWTAHWQGPWEFPPRGKPELPAGGEASDATTPLITAGVTTTLLILTALIILAFLRCALGILPGCDSWTHFNSLKEHVCVCVLLDM